MPLEYAGGGVLAEHTAVRESVGVFDVSHLGKASVRGPGAAAFIDATLTNDLDAHRSPAQAAIHLCADDASGGVVDDLIVYLRGDDDVFLVPNAANTAEVVRRLAAAAPDGVEVREPASRFRGARGARSALAELLDAAGLPSAHPYMSFVDTSGRRVGGRPHGRDGLPIGLHRRARLRTCGRQSRRRRCVGPRLRPARALGVRACGLGARDTLRTEMGYPLHGQDLSLDITPEPGARRLGGGLEEAGVLGTRGLLAERAAGPRRVLRGLDSLDRGIPRPHMVVKSRDGEVVGEVTSGTFSPTRRVGIALALLRPDIVEGDEVEVDVRGRPSAMRVVKPPFIEGSRHGMSRAERIVLIGMMGAGKSTVGASLSKLTGWPYIDNDQVVEQMVGMPTRDLLQQQGRRGDAGG